MMATRKALAALAAASLVFGGTAATAAPAEVENVRTASPVDGAENLRGSFLWILAVVIAIGVIGVFASDSGTPASP